MRLMIRIIVMLVAAGALVFVIGWFLPVGQVASTSATFAKTPLEVYDTVADMSRYPSWWSEISRIEMLPDETDASAFGNTRAPGPS